MTTTLRRPRPVRSGTPTAAREPRTRPETRRGRGRYLALNTAGVVAIAVVALGIISILYLIQTSQVAQLGYQVSRLQKEQDTLINQNAQLSYQVAREHSLDVVQKIALTQLGMTPMRSYEFLQVRRPPQDELPALAPETAPHSSLLTRVRRALTGASQASHTPSSPKASGGQP